MKYDPKYIIFYAVVKYWSEEQLEKFKKALAKKNPSQNRAFVTVVKKFFDLERLKDNPMAWQDIWVYNYIQYDMKNRDSYLLRRYEEEVIIPVEKYFREVIKFIY